jgi:hypothetical protein
MKQIQSFLSAVLVFISGCGDLEMGADDIAGGESKVVSSPDGLKTRETAGESESNDNKNGMCLTNCDNGVWKNLMLEELPIQKLPIAEGCSLVHSAAFPRDPKIEILSVVACSGLSRLYLWSVNNLGAIVDLPVQISQCPLGQSIKQLRRAVGTNGVLTLWSCAEGSSYSSPNNYNVRVESLDGTQLYSRLLTNFWSRMEVEVVYAKEADLWAVAFKGKLFRLNRSGLLSGSTTWSADREPMNLTVRNGVFQIMEGRNSCSRVTLGGTLLCQSISMGDRFDSSQPVEGSRYLLMQDGYEVSMSSDSPSTCSATGEALTITRHAESHSILRAMAIAGTPYIASLAESDGKLLFNLIQTSPAMQHLSSIPVEDANKWLRENLSLFQMGERVYATLVSQSGVRVVSIPKPGVAK